MRLTNRQRCLYNLLLVGWTLVEGRTATTAANVRYHLDHPERLDIPPGFEWVDYMTVNGLYKRDLLVQCHKPGERTRWRIK